MFCILNNELSSRGGGYCGKQQRQKKTNKQRNNKIKKKHTHIQSYIHVCMYIHIYEHMHIYIAHKFHKYKEAIFYYLWHASIGECAVAADVDSRKIFKSRLFAVI